MTPERSVGEILADRSVGPMTPERVKALREAAYVRSVMGLVVDASMLNELLDEVEALRKALESIADFQCEITGATAAEFRATCGKCPSCIARAALGEG